MTHLERNKPAKSVTPSRTIARIQHILKGLGCRAETWDCSQRAGLFYSYHLTLHRHNEPHTLFACNGKGMTPELALASAYGELMERLQNMAFYMATVYYSEIETARRPSHPISDFQYTPDERAFAAEELVRREWPLLKSLLSLPHAGEPTVTDYLHSKLKWGRMQCIPFRDTSTNEEHFLPCRFMHWIVGSNGMCAGNTREEALIQGVSEILERAVLKAMYIQPFTPPDVPAELFSGHMIYDKMRQLERHEHLRVVIKDCSLAKQLPVLGILVYSDNDQTYAFHLGADPSPITALERCFTELFQGGPPAFHAVPSSVMAGDVTCSPFWRQQLHHSIQSYSGQWPPHLLANTPDYEFRGFPFRVSHSDVDDLDRLLRLVQELNCRVFVREAGFLGFPAYHVYVPGMSEITNAIDNRFLEQLVAFERQSPLFFTMHKASPAEQEELAQLIALYAEAALSGEFDASTYFRHYTSAPVTQMRSHEIVSALRNHQVPVSQPTCFDCPDCKVAGCAFASMNALWQSVKNRQLPPSKEDHNATAF
jgi:ribosomal protein S12 methylthiotransferase accessory factor